MKKYTPSVKNNNELKEEILAELNAMLYRMSKGKFDQSLDNGVVQAALKTLRAETDDFENAIGTGKEDIESVFKGTKKAVSQVKKLLEQQLNSKFEAAVEDLCFNISMWREVLTGTIVDVDKENINNVKLSWSKKRLNQKLGELREIKEDYSSNERRLEVEIRDIEKELAELEDKMVAEDNERIINELYRRITSAKSKIDSLNVRRSNYSVCFNLIDMIEININEIIAAGKYTTAELNKAKGMLNMSRIRETVVNPEKAIPILKVIQDDIKQISEKIKTVDEKIFGNLQGQATITNDALSYKEELLKKRREKASLKAASDEMASKQESQQVSNTVNDIKGE